MKIPFYEGEISITGAMLLSIIFIWGFIFGYVASQCAPEAKAIIHQWSAP